MAIGRTMQTLVVSNSHSPPRDPLYSTIQMECMAIDNNLFQRHVIRHIRERTLDYNGCPPPV